MKTKEIKEWKKLNASAIEEINPWDYLGARGLQLIENLEGHQKIGLKKVNGINTNHYGVTQAGIDGLREMSGKFNTKIPDWIVGAKVEALNRDQCREITQYIAALNTMLVDDLTETGNFSSWDLDKREAFLSYFHNETPYKLTNSFKRGSQGSVLLHIKENNPYRALQALLEDGEGNFAGEYINENGERNGYRKRCLVPYFAFGNPDYSFSASESLEMENKLRMGGYVKESYENMKDIASCYDVYNLNNAMYGDANQAISQSNSEVCLNQKKGGEQEDVPNANINEKQTPSDSFLPDRLGKIISNFTNNVKNLFTNNQEDKNVATRNKNVNM